jgi:hypothetical protein
MSKLAIYNPEEDEVFAGMLRGQMLTFECFGKGDRLKVRIAIFMKDDRAYIITCTSEANKFPRYEPLFMKAIRSFRSK